MVARVPVSSVANVSSIYQIVFSAKNNKHGILGCSFNISNNTICLKSDTKQMH